VSESTRTVRSSGWTRQHDNPHSLYLWGARRGRKCSCAADANRAIESSGVANKSGRSLQPSPLAELRKINSRRSIPSPCAVTSTELQSELLVPIRNPQRRPCRRIWLGGH